MIRRFVAIAGLLMALGAGGAWAVRSNYQGEANLPPLTPMLDPIAQGPDPSSMPRGGMGWLRELNLSPEQMQRIKAIRSQHQEPLKQQRQALRQAQQQLQTLMASAASKQDVLAQYRQVESQRQRLAELQFTSMLEVREVLTLEQRQQVATKMQQRREQFRQRWQG